jgi:hypothetical protein
MSDITNAMIALLRVIGAWLAQYNAVDLFAIFIFMAFWFWLWRSSANPQNTFDLTDSLKDSYTNKASGAALMYVFLGGLSSWYVVRTAVNGGDPTNFLITMLTVFIVKGGADRAMSAWGIHKPPEAPPLPDPPGSPDDKAKGEVQEKDKDPIDSKLSSLGLR